MTLSNRMIAWILLLIGLVVMPFVLPKSMATEILIYGIVAVAANLLLGYGGIFSFGQASFFGIGGYVGGYLLIHYKVPLIVALFAGALAGGISAAIIGAICVRRTGIYLIMLTFAFNQMVYYISYQLKDITGGEDGMAGIIRPPLEIPGLLTLKFNTPMNFYILAAVIFFICFWIMYRVVESPFGKIMVATRDNPVRSASIGYHVKRAQILMFTISGIFTGVAGVIFGMHYWIMPIDSIHWLNSGFIVFMVLIGGTTSPFGPVLGTTIFIALQDLFGMIWERWPLLLGLVLVCIVLFLHGGVLEIINRVTTAIQRRKQAEGFVPTNGS